MYEAQLLRVFPQHPHDSVGALGMLLNIFQDHWLLKKISDLCSDVQVHLSLPPEQVSDLTSPVGDIPRL